MTQEMIIPEPPSEDEVKEVVEEVVEEEENPHKEANGDDLSDLFTVPKQSDPDMRVDDLIDIDIERDVIDGDLSDITKVTNEDVMGKDVYAKKPKKVVRKLRRNNVPYQYVSPTRSIGGIR